MTSTRSAPRIAIGGFMLESNSHAPVATRAEFEANVLLAGDALAADLDALDPATDDLFGEAAANGLHLR